MKKNFLIIRIILDLYALFLHNSEGGPPPPASPLGSIQPDLYQRRDGPIYLKARGYVQDISISKYSFFTSLSFRIDINYYLLVFSILFL